MSTAPITASASRNNIQKYPAGRSALHSTASITSLNRMIKNAMYIGIIKNGDSQSQYIEELRIIGDDIFAQAQEIMRCGSVPSPIAPFHPTAKGNPYW